MSEHDTTYIFHRYNQIVMRQETEGNEKRGTRNGTRTNLLRVSSGLNNLFIFSELREARSRLYRRQILQINIRWKALDEIYKMYILLHRSDLKISAKKVVIRLVKMKQ